MTAAHCPGCTGHRVLSISGPIVTAQFGQPCPGVDNSALVEALEDIKGALLYCPPMLCSGCVSALCGSAREVACRCIPTCDARARHHADALERVNFASEIAGLREHAGTWITEDEDRRISSDGP